MSLTRVPPEEVLSAHIDLHTPRTKVTGHDTISMTPRYNFATENMNAVTAAFRRAGFTLGPVIGYAFTISAAAEFWERFFDVELFRHPSGRVTCGKHGTASLPMERLSGELQRRVRAVVFVDPTP
jgi:hypothetical protein